MNKQLQNENKPIVTANPKSTVIAIEGTMRSLGYGVSIPEYYIYLDTDGNMTDAELAVYSVFESGGRLFGLQKEVYTHDKLKVGETYDTSFVGKKAKLETVKKDPRINKNPSDSTSVVSREFDSHGGLLGRGQTTLIFATKNENGTTTYRQGTFVSPTNAQVFPGATMPESVLIDFRTFSEVKEIPPFIEK